MNRSAVVALMSLGPLWWILRHRRSDVVRRWRAPHPGGRSVDGLYFRTAGDGDTVFVLLHGLVATGDVFGAEFDTLANEGKLVVPDLLGFGRSLDETRSTFGAEQHLDALDRLMDELGVGSRPIVVGAHSMGSALAVRWAERRGIQIRRVVGWGAPVYRNAAQVEEEVASMGTMARLLAGNTRAAELACKLNCRHRKPAGWLAALAAPEIPVQIARAASLHTWPAYRDAMSDVVGGTDWAHVTRRVFANGTTIELTWGDGDAIGDRGFAGTLPGVRVTVVPGSGHHLPMAHPGRCLEQLRTVP